MGAPQRACPAVASVNSNSILEKLDGIEACALAIFNLLALSTTAELA
jgi:hypothetical protein